MDAELFLEDILKKPAYLRSFAGELRAENPWNGTPATSTTRLVFVGMGSSHFANLIAASRLQAQGINAVATLASAMNFPAVKTDEVVILVSASGTSQETLAAAKHYASAIGAERCISVTNTTGSALEQHAAHHVAMQAGVEAGGVACRSFQHTIALHLALIEGGKTPFATSAAMLRAADAVEDLIDRQEAWVCELGNLLLGPQGSTLVAPVERLSSAQQGALMLREGPRLPAIACETGDWSHIDVYLTKTTDYRMLLFAGSPWERELLTWCQERRSTFVCVGAKIDGAAFCLTYPHQADADTALLTEVFVPELIAAQRWREQ